MVTDSDFFYSDDEFYQILLKEDDLGVVIRVHIIFEQLLNEFIDYFIPLSGKLDEVKLSYYQKIRLAVLCGLKKENINCYQTLGKIRNQFAHKPKTELTNEMVDGWHRSLSDRGKKCVQLSLDSINAKLPAENKHPAFDKLNHKDRFALIAVALRALLIAANKAEGEKEKKEVGS
jgi:hypothetical protein